MSNPFSLEGKNIIITGCAGILGRHFSKAALEMGASLAMIDRDKDGLLKLQDEYSSHFKNKIKSYVCDLTQYQEVKNTVEKIISDFGQIHVLHNNAAGKTKNVDDFFEPYETFNPDVWKEIMDINLNSMFYMSQLVGRHMAEKKSGSIIQTASIYGVVAPDQRIYKGSFYFNREISSPAVYSASKAAVIGLSSYLSAYWGHCGVRVNTITPGGVQSGQNQTFLDNYSKRVPLGRMAKESDLLGAFIYLASDASSYVTGQNIIVDGGLTVW